MNTVQLGGLVKGGGNGSGSGNLESEAFNGDGAETEFTLADSDGVPKQVDVGGQLLIPGTDFTVTDNSVTLTFAPAVGQTVVVYYQSTQGSTTIDPYNRITADTSGAAIELNMGNKTKRAFNSSHVIDQDSTVSFLNHANMIEGTWAFEVDAARVLTLPDEVVMPDDDAWDDVAKTWTPAAAAYPAKYLMKWSSDGANYTTEVIGPNS
jgi:hypothetical protein